MCGKRWENERRNAKPRPPALATGNTIPKLSNSFLNIGNNWKVSFLTYVNFYKGRFLLAKFSQDRSRAFSFLSFDCSCSWAPEDAREEDRAEREGLAWACGISSTRRRRNIKGKEKESSCFKRSVCLLILGQSQSGEINFFQALHR